MSLRPQHVAQELLTKVTKVLGITALDQWYYVSHHTATRVIGTRTLNKFGGSLSSFLKHAYPLHHFDEQKLASTVNIEKNQKFVEVIIRKLFPNTEIHTKARKAVGIINPETEAYLEIDFWMPSLKLGIEYQDKHHYGHQWYANDTLEEYQKRDDIKKAAMSSLGYTLITIGFWWDKSLDSVAATIRKYRPDLLKEYKNVRAAPIPPEPPHDIITSSPVIPGIVGLMSPSVPKSNFNPIDWYAGEKYDGVRGVYNPGLRKMFSRTGNELSIVDSLLEDIPRMLVEGEILAGRGNYNKTSAVSSHTQHDRVNWPMLRYIAYDIPDAQAGNYTYRYSAIVKELLKHPFVFAQSVFRVLLSSKSQLKMLVDAIISDAGEGVIVQQDTQYEYGRAKGLAKIKVHRDDDAQVLRINKGSCTCKLVNGATADIPLSNDFDPSTLKVGDIISYYHNGYWRSGSPKRGEIYKVRYDINWDELVGERVQNSKRRSFQEAIGSNSLVARKLVRNKMGYWNKPPNVRAFVESFARTSGFDPLVVENWYSVRVTSLQKAGGGGLLTAYNGNMYKILSRAYPELKFEAGEFKTHQIKVKKGYWNKTPNVREFFDDFALIAGFDPLVPENWYSVMVSSVQQAGGSGVLGAHNKHIKNALACAYPELNFDKEKFHTHAVKGHWTQPENVRAFFDVFAETAGFDPLVAENWNTVRHSSVQKAKGGGILKAYDFDLRKALAFAYPEVWKNSSTKN